MAELDDRISSPELTEWMAFYQLEPFGQEVQDIRTALICRTIASVAGAKRNDGEPLTIEDFLLDWSGSKQEKQMSPEDMLARAKLMTAMLTAVHQGKNG